MQEKLENFKPAPESKLQSGILKVQNNLDRRT